MFPKKQTQYNMLLQEMLPKLWGVPKGLQVQGKSWCVGPDSTPPLCVGPTTTRTHPGTKYHKQF